MWKSVFVATPLVALSTAFRSTVANEIGTEGIPDSDDETIRTAISGLPFMVLSIFSANMKAGRMARRSRRKFNLQTAAPLGYVMGDDDGREWEAIPWSRIEAVPSARRSYSL